MSAPRTNAAPARALGAVAALSSLVVAACSAKAGDPTSADVVVDFPSVAAAVAAETVTIAVYDAPTQRACQELVESTRSHAPLRPSLASSDPLGPCAARPRMAVDYGRRAFLVTAQRGGQGFLLGCTVAEVYDGSGPTPVSLALFDDTQSVPSTKCSKLSDFCGGKC